MPVLNSKETLAIIKSEKDTQSIPVIIFTTSSSPADNDFCKKFEVEMITKPTTPGELDNVITKLLSSCQ
ncbi:MAG: hypothetical protein ACSLE0_04435 [Chitinophagaceae bacterium]